MAEKSFITRLLCELDGIKTYHWQTTTYARHIASDSLHGKLSALVDQFVEVYLGERGKRPSFGESDVVHLYNQSDDEAMQALKDLAVYIGTDLKEVAGDSVSLNHIVEEMSSAVHQANYLYTFS